MPDDTPNWGVNPFAVAELITGQVCTGEKERLGSRHRRAGDAFRPSWS